MKRLLTMFPLLLIAGTAGAIERHDATSMTCQELKSTLMSEKKAILRVPSTKVPGLVRYDAYVAERPACGAPPNGAVWARVKASDGTCRIYRCQQITKPHAN